MPSLLDTLEELFQTRDLYVALGVEGDGKTCSEKDLKKSYHKSSLKYHPDRVAGRSDDVIASATKKFQALGAVYKILSDKDGRALYDESGEIADEDDGIGGEDRDWNEYWRLLFPKITLKNIQDFEEKYKGSEEEEKDLIVAYEAAKGDMDQILGDVMCATLDDEQRFAEKLEKLIEEGNLKEYPAFKKMMTKSAKSKRASKARKEAKEAEELSKELGFGANCSLETMIMKRQAARAKEGESFLDQLAAKYAKPSKKKK